MGLFGLFGGGNNKKPLEDYLYERDAVSLRKCVEQEIIVKTGYPFENNAKNGYFWGYACTSFLWGVKTFNESKEYEAIPKKYERDLDFRKILQVAADKGDGRAAFYVAIFYEFGMMGPKFIENLAGALSENDPTPERLYEMADSKMADKYHAIASEKCPEFENGYIFLQQYIVAMTDAKGAEATHMLADLMTVPCSPQIETGLKNVTGDLYLEFKLFGRFLSTIFAGFRAPLPLATIAIGKDLFVSNDITQGPDVLLGMDARIEPERIKLVRGQALGYVNRLANEGNKEAKYAKKRYGIESTGRPAVRPSVDGGMSGSSGSSGKRLPKPGDLPGTIFKNGVTYSRTSGCDDYAFYDSVDRTQSLRIYSVISMSQGSAETDAGHIEF